MIVIRVRSKSTSKNRGRGGGGSGVWDSLCKKYRKSALRGGLEPEITKICGLNIWTYPNQLIDSHFDSIFWKDRNITFACNNVGGNLLRNILILVGHPTKPAKGIRHRYQDKRCVGVCVCVCACDLFQQVARNRNSIAVSFVCSLAYVRCRRRRRPGVLRSWTTTTSFANLLR